MENEAHETQDGECYPPPRFYRFSVHLMYSLTLPIPLKSTQASSLLLIHFETEVIEQHVSGESVKAAR